MIEIDGSIGGGQIVRTSLALSAITGESFSIQNVRGNRSKPGLRNQHVKCVESASKLCNAETEGVYQNSEHFVFEPSNLKSIDLSINIDTAASIGLLFQAIYLPAFFTKGNVNVKIYGGATYGKWSPPVSFITDVFGSILSKMGLNFDLDVKRHGFYPKGGAMVEFRLPEYIDLKPINMVNRGKLRGVKGYSLASEHLRSADVALRQSEEARSVLSKYIDENINIDVSYFDTKCPGSGIVLASEYKNTVLGSSCIGEKGKPSEKVGGEAAQDLIDSINSDACFDKYTADQILLPLSLSTVNGRSKIKVEEITEHCKTNSKVIEKFLPVNISFEDDRKIKIGRN